jgi:hypothetical protein
MVRHDSASQLPQSFGFSDDRDLRGISVTSEHTHQSEVAALENVPHAERVINAVLSAFIIILRPPMDAV